jgi:ethanolamine ammonia-lyase small subunit
LTDEIAADPWARFRAATRARIALGRAGDALPTKALLEFQLAHARARDAVHGAIDFDRLARQIGAERPVLRVHSAAEDRATYLRRPDLGRRLDEASRSLLRGLPAPARPWDVAFVLADGLSGAIDRHAVPQLRACLARLQGLAVAPIVLAENARVALGDEIGALLDVSVCVVLIGERPGLSVADSLGIYLTWAPLPGRNDAERNCLSNIHADGLSYDAAATKLAWLVTEARRRKLSGVDLKEEAARPVTPISEER